MFLHSSAPASPTHAGLNDAMTPNVMSRDGSPQPEEQAVRTEIDYQYAQLATAVPIPLTKLAHIPHDMKCSQSAPGSPSRPFSMYIIYSRAIVLFYITFSA